jgi:hypothetical protein
MRFSNFCTTCGERLTQKRWRLWLRGAVCDACAVRSGRAIRLKPIVAIASMGLATFALGRYLRPSPPPLIIQRAANSPLSDLPIKLDAIATGESNFKSPSAAPADETVYLCGARTQKGTPCRRRVHVLGERCYQHKGRAAMVPLEKLTIKP